VGRSVPLERGRRGGAVSGRARCRRAEGLRGAAGPRTARCRRAEDPRGGAVSGRARCRWAGDRHAGADCPARCCPVEAPHAARSRHPGQCRAGPRRRAAVPAGQGCLPGPRRRETAGRRRNQRGGRVQATPRPATGLAPGARASEHPTGRLAARRCALPENPWRERIPLSGWHRAVRHFPGPVAYSPARKGFGDGQAVWGRLPPERPYGSRHGHLVGPSLMLFLLGLRRPGPCAALPAERFPHAAPALAGLAGSRSLPGAGPAGSRSALCGPSGPRPLRPALPCGSPLFPAPYLLFTFSHTSQFSRK
jgi:hypothetical protein